MRVISRCLSSARAHTGRPVTAPLLKPTETSTPALAGVHSTKPQYFLSYAVLGAIVPFVSVLLAERGLSRQQIGNVWAVSSLGVIFTPILVTLLADSAIAARVLMAGLFALAGLFLALLAPAAGFWPILALYALHTFALQPIFPLQDGVHFAAQALRRGRGLAEAPYHTVRVWGSVGYIVPGAVLYFFLKPGAAMTPVLVCGIACCAAGVVYALFFLPRTPPPPRDVAHARLPTLAAARAIGERHVLIFCAAMFLLHAASQAYYQFYPIHLTERAGIDKRWVGLIANVGVVIEIFFMLAFGRLVRWLTLRRVMYVGALAIAVRMLLLAVVSNAYVAVGVQLAHGLAVLVIHVAPPIFLDARASDRYRNSMQGLYTMAFAGAGKVVGAFASGWVAQRSLPLTFALSAGVCLLATGMFYFAFEERRHET
ncbi:MAG: putative major facilitator superfamily protein [Phycisphaerales bacterium]|nr:putative major facilitator superfamily protein [Phycisphaerales bacterium]